MVKIQSMFVILGVTGFTACASTRAIAPDELVEVKSSIQAAEQADLDAYPNAKLHVKLARDQLDHAQALMDSAKTKEASQAMERARMDAELALQIVRTQKSKEASDRMKERFDRIEKNAN